MAHAGWARALARRLVGDPDAAEDLVQETLVAGWKHPPAQDRPLRPWLATVLRNLARTRHRGAGRARRRHDQWHEDAVAVASPEEALTGLQAQQRLAGMFARLSEPYRHALYLRYVDGLSAAEIARSQGVPEGTVRWRIKTGLDQLRQWFADEDGPDWRRALLPLGGVAAAPPAPGKAASSGGAKAAAAVLGLAAVAVLFLGTSALLRSAPPLLGVSALPEDPARSAALGPPPSALVLLDGRVFAPDGTPAGGAVVVARGPGLPIDPQVAAADGRFRFPGLSAGRYSVTASAGSWLPARAELDVAAGASVELRLTAGGAQLRGQVLDATAGPVPFARIEATVDQPPLRAVVLANQEGRFSLRLPLGSHQVAASADGYARRTAYVHVAGDLQQDFFLQPAAVLAGQVVDADSGDPVADAFVRATMNDDRRNYDGRSDGDGRFRLTGLEPGHYRVFARKQTRVGFAAAPVVLAVAARVEGVAVPIARSFSVSGRVLNPEGDPQPGAKVGIEEARGAGFAFSQKQVKATTDKLGRYRIDGLVAGVYHLGAHASPLGDADDVTVAVAASDSQAPDLHLGPAAKVEGRVFAADGTPLAGVEVSLEVRAADDGNALVRGRSNRRSDTDGRFHADDLGAGWLTVSTAGPRGDTVTSVVQLIAGQTRQVELRLEPAAFVEGRVLWADGQPAAGVHVVWNQSDHRALTGADGRYRLGPLAPGSGGIHAERPGSNNHTGSSHAEPSERSLKLRAGETTRAEDLILERGDRAISGVVLGPDGSPLAGATVEARPTGDTPDRSWTRTAVVSGADGAFMVPALTRGQHLVQASDPRFPTAELKADGGSRNVRIRFAAPARLAGALVDPSGRPVAVATVRVVPTEGLGRRQLTFGSAEGTSRRVEDRSGRFSIEPLAAGTYDLLVTTPAGGAGRVARIGLHAGQTRDDLRVVVGPGLTIEGRVLAFGSDEPIAQATVAMANAGPHVETRTDARGVFRLERQVPGRIVYLQIGGPRPYGDDVWAVVLAAEGTTQQLPPVRVVKATARPQLPDGISFSGEIGPLRAVQVAPGSVFATAGVRPGDSLRSVDGRDARGLGWAGLGLVLATQGKADLMFEAPDGSQKRVTVAAGSP